MSTQVDGTDDNATLLASLYWKVGGNIHTQRIKLGLEEAECAAALGISKRKLYGMEWGDIRFNLLDYVLIQEELNELIVD